MMNTAIWSDLFKSGGPRNRYPHSYVVSWYFTNATGAVTPDSRVLDLGCGTGPDISLFLRQGHDYHGLDVTSTCFNDILERVENWHLDQSRVTLQTFLPPTIPYPDHHFDLLVGLESLHFNHSPELMSQALTEVRRVLRPGGKFFFSCIDHGHYFAITKHSNMIGDCCLELSQGFPEPNRRGLRYFLFKDEEQIRQYFDQFAQVQVGHYLLDVNDQQPDSYFLIWGEL